MRSARRDEDTARDAPTRTVRRTVLLAMAPIAVLTLVATGLALSLPGPKRAASNPPTRPATLKVPVPPTVVVGALVTNVRGGLQFGAPVIPQGGWCSLGACWTTIVTSRGYLYPVQGSYGARQWHIAGPALAGPGVSPQDHFISVDSRSSTRAVVWTGPNSFVSTHDGGRHWYRVTSIRDLVAVGDAGASSVSITIGLPGPRACDFYFTYSSISGTVWRRSGPLRSFTTTAIAPTTPSCLADEHFGI
jgi:hypothetical protein